MVIQNDSVYTFNHSNTHDCILAFPTELNSYFTTLFNDHLTLKKRARVGFFSEKYFCRQLLYILTLNAKKVGSLQRETLIIFCEKIPLFQTE